MNKYKVTAEQITTLVVEVEAENEEQAEALTEFSDWEEAEMSISITNIQQIN